VNASEQAEKRAARHSQTAQSAILLQDATKHAHASATAANVAYQNARQWPTPEAKTSAKRAARSAAKAIQSAANLAHHVADNLDI
jgi:hypothetical protein